MFNLVEEAKLSDIPENVEEPNVSLEVLSLPKSNIETKNDGDVTEDRRESIISPDSVRYTISPLKSGNGNLISFYLNVVNLTSQAINQFVMLCDALVKKDDAIMVHLNSVLYCDEAETIYNAIVDCKAKMKIAGAPYTLNTAAFYPVLACDYVIPFKYAFHVFDVPSIRSGGDLKDAKNAYEFDSERKLDLLRSVHAAGFLDDEAMTNIVERQGIYSLYGEKRDKAADRFNTRKA